MFNIHWISQSPNLLMGSSDLSYMDRFVEGIRNRRVQVSPSFEVDQQKGLAGLRSVLYILQRPLPCQLSALRARDNVFFVTKTIELCNTKIISTMRVDSYVLATISFWPRTLLSWHPVTCIPSPPEYLLQCTACTIKPTRSEFQLDCLFLP